jgi:YrbI family 3-deoxy-D-manno-octulosonate 8-phosphate phosphatase
MKNKNNIKLVATDIDGVWTDARMHYTENGDFMKSFSTYDGMAVQLLREKNIETVIITSEDSNIVLQRAKKLNILNVYIGEKNKLDRIKKICLQKQIDLTDVAYIGDDLNDIDILNEVGFSALTHNSPIKEQIKVDYITKTSGGNGAFREFVDLILKDR